MSQKKNIALISVACVAALILLHIVLAARSLDHTAVFNVWGEQVEFTHPSWDRDFYELYGQHVIVPCTNVWDLNQRTNCRIRCWGIGLNGYKPFIEWRITSMDKDANWK